LNSSLEFFNDKLHLSEFQLSDYFKVTVWYKGIWASHPQDSVTNSGYRRLQSSFFSNYRKVLSQTLRFDYWVQGVCDNNAEEIGMCDQ
jgi:hypothetical protein